MSVLLLFLDHDKYWLASGKIYITCMLNISYIIFHICLAAQVLPKFSAHGQAHMGQMGK